MFHAGGASGTPAPVDMTAPTRLRRSPLALTRQRAARLHRWVGLAVCAFWLLQAVTGVLSVFHWELEDAVLSHAWQPTNLHAIEARLLKLAPPGSARHVTTVWTTAGLPDRYDVTVADEGSGRKFAIRIAGDGTILRVKDKNDRGFLDRIVGLHQTLLMGDTGRWIVAISGLLLITNLLLGLRAAWPAAGRWRATLFPKPARGAAARVFVWHRALGLMLVVPGLVLVAAGIAREFEDGLSSLIGAHAPALEPQPALGPRDVGFAAAAAAALAATHARSLTMVVMPTAGDATYKVRVLAPAEARRAYGTSVIFVDAARGTVRGIFPAASAPLPRRFMDALYAIHTGEIGGLVGRLIVLMTGIWLSTMVVLGVLLWRLRRRSRAKTAPSQRAA
jgi:uncharacterized iron-regulated membrane protein